MDQFGLFVEISYLEILATISTELIFNYLFRHFTFIN